MDRGEILLRAGLVLRMMDELAKKTHSTQQEYDQILKRSQALERTWRNLMDELNDGHDETKGTD
jgi:hypothetical protein